MKANPADARAPYYLGNLLFDLQPERAISCWERSRVSRPVIFARPQESRPGLCPGEERSRRPRWPASSGPSPWTGRTPGCIYELDLLYEAAGTDPRTRLALLEKNHDVVAGNDNALAREVGLLLLDGRSAKALEILKTPSFPCLGRGRGDPRTLGRGQPRRRAAAAREEGLSAGRSKPLLNALSYPPNLDVGPPSSGPGSPKIFFHLGQAQEALGNRAEAVVLLRKGRRVPDGTDGTGLLFRAGPGRSSAGPPRPRRASRTWSVEAREALAAAPAMDFFEKFGERQSARIRQATCTSWPDSVSSGSGRRAEATAEFEKAAAMDPGHLDVRRFLKR